MSQKEEDFLLTHPKIFQFYTEQITKSKILLLMPILWWKRLVPTGVNDSSPSLFSLTFHLLRKRNQTPKYLFGWKKDYLGFKKKSGAIKYQSWTELQEAFFFFFCNAGIELGSHAYKACTFLLGHILALHEAFFFSLRSYTKPSHLHPCSPTNLKAEGRSYIRIHLIFCIEKSKSSFFQF